MVLVEDAPEVRALTQRMLDALGYVVYATGDPHDGLRLASELPDGPMALVSDVDLPEMSGRELADRLRGERERVAVVLMSGHSDAMLDLSGLDDPRRVLRKPFTRAELADRLRTALDQVFAEDDSSQEV